MTRNIRCVPLTKAAFAPFGDVIESLDSASYPINGGMCERFHDLARTEAIGGRVGISLGEARPYALPLELTLVERHPLGSQAFVPLGSDPFLVIVAPEIGGRPGPPLAFLTATGQGVNYLRGIWHGVLTPLGRPASFLIVDRIGTDANLEEYAYPDPWTVVA